MVSQFLMIFTLVSIWISLIWGVVILVSGVHFWLKHSDFKVDKKALPYYPKVTIVVPAHNEDVVIAQTAKAILNLNLFSLVSLTKTPTRLASVGRYLGIWYRYLGDLG